MATNNIAHSIEAHRAMATYNKMRDAKNWLEFCYECNGEMVIKQAEKDYKLALEAYEKAQSEFDLLAEA